MPDAHAHGSNLLGPRIAAALIDIALLLVLLVVLAVLVGEASVEGGTFSFALGGASMALYVALVLLYYLVLEWTIGQTVGKLLLGLRVVRAGGGRPSVWAVAIRTVLRIVDWLPLLYLVGFIAMLSTGARPRRLGDLAAGTEIMRADPMRHRRLAAAGLAASLGVILAGSIIYTASNDDEAVQTDRDTPPPQEEETAPAQAVEVDVYELRVGDCFIEDAEEEFISTVQVVPCPEPHGAEVYALVTLPDGDFPGQDAINAQGQELCIAEFEDFVGLSYWESMFEVWSMLPAEDAWRAGDREVICNIYDPGGNVSGSLSGAKR
jgi:uncharacterized RDD family membrane protein YckC